MKKQARKANQQRRLRSPVDQQQIAEREAILDERHELQKLFPAPYNPQISIFNPNKVEVMLTVSRAQAENLARLLKQHKL